MKEHIQECPVNSMPIHMSNLDHYYGRYECQCEILHACEQRMLKENFCILSYSHALDTAREAVDLLPAPYKVRGDFDTYSSYNEGRMDMKDAVLSAIDALRKD